MKPFYSAIFTIAAILLSLCNYTLHAQWKAAEDIERWGDFNNWRVREIKESRIIGGQTKYSYEIAKGDTLKGEIPYVNPPGCVWSTSSVMAIVSGVTKVSCTVFPEQRDSGYCVRLETRLEKVKVLGLVNLNVIAAGTVFLGQMIEPIRDTKNPQSKLNCGIPFTERPKAVMFDYKTIVGNNVYRAGGLGAPKRVGNKDNSECVVMLQKRWEDEEGNVYSKRVGTAYERFTQTDTTWNNGHIVLIHYGDITNEPFYRDYMKLILPEFANYMINSKGKSVPIQEVGWAEPDEIPTHIIMRFSASMGEAYVGDITNRLWIDNVKFIY